MAEEWMEMPLTPEVAEPNDDRLRRSSLTPKLIEPKDGSLRRSSTGIPSTSSSVEKILPNHLRASTGSCHDFCKYGRQHAFDRKGKHPILKGKKSVFSEGQYPMKGVTPQTRQKKPAVKLTSSPDPGTQSYDIPEINKQESKHPILKGEKIILSEGQHAMKTASPKMRKKKPAVKLTLSPDPGSQSCDIPEIKKQETKIAMQKALSPAKKISDVVKSSVAFKPKRGTEKSPPSPLNRPRDQRVRRDADVMTGKMSNSSNIGQKKVLVLPKASLYPKTSSNRTTSLKTQQNKVLKGASPKKIENKAEKDEPKLPIDENVIEKTIYIIEPKPEYKSLELDPTEDVSLVSLSTSLMPVSPPPSLAFVEKEEYVVSEYDESEAESECDGTETDCEYVGSENQNQLEISKEEYRRRPRKSVTVHPDENDPGHKLKFRRGKVVDLQSENNALKKLIFRKRRVLGDDQNSNGDFRRNFFKKIEVNDTATTGEPESEKVVLRHQDVNGKKDSQGLFNNVIEETASKLAETRKSKVKALVGAFETVISLQENKPSAASSG